MFFIFIFRRLLSLSCNPFAAAMAHSTITVPVCRLDRLALVELSQSWKPGQIIQCFVHMCGFWLDVFRLGLSGDAFYVSCVHLCLLFASYLQCPFFFLSVTHRSPNRNIFLASTLSHLPHFRLARSSPLSILPVRTQSHFCSLLRKYFSGGFLFSVKNVSWNVSSDL